MRKEYEYQLMARILADKNAYLKHSDVITVEHFRHYRNIFECFVGFVAQGRHPSVSKITSSLPSLKNEILSMLADVDYSIPVEDLVDELEEHRRLELVNNTIVRLSFLDKSDDKIQVLADLVTSVYGEDRASYVTAYEVAKEVVRDVLSETTQGIPTGFRYFDKLTGGLQPSDLVIVAGETSQGKTSLALNIVQNIVATGTAASFISLEMSKKQLMSRMISSESGVPRADFKSKYPIIESAASDYSERNLFIADIVNSGLAYVCGLIRAAHMKYNIRVAVVDYLQLVTDKTKSSREQEVGHIARTLKNLAKELDINIIAISQLSRPQKGGNHYPTLARLRDSGQVEEAADIVMFVYRPEFYGITEYYDNDTAGLAELIVAKGRNYGTGKFFVQFTHNITRFSDTHYSDRGGDDRVSSGVDGEGNPF